VGPHRVEELDRPLGLRDRGVADRAARLRAGIANSSVLATSRAIDNCSGVGLPGSFPKLTTECDPQCAQAFDQHSSYYSEK
jgi:hypothetical protein